ncbi:hypothetical protein [Thermoflexus sp.]|uniref:hypothetical protein n=1 Tax=Thermoflexus sp. TaxID=1969742 RepID=UPI0035E4461B
MNSRDFVSATKWTEAQVQRLAWITLLLSFAACIGLSILIPWRIVTYFRTAYIGTPARVSALSGILRLEHPEREPVAITPGAAYPRLTEGDLLITDAQSQGLVIFSEPLFPTPPDLAAVQIYPNTQVEVRYARYPRFGISPEPARLTLYVRAGRIRVIRLESRRALELVIQTPHGQAEVLSGALAVEVQNDRADFTVRSGEARVGNSTGIRIVRSDQRARIGLDGRVEGPLGAGRNLLPSLFQAPLPERKVEDPVPPGQWAIFQFVKQPGESLGTVAQTSDAGRRVLAISRSGFDHAQTGVFVVLNQDVRDFRSLQLHISLKILSQDVAVCGVVGTECPLMIRLEYKDINGSDRQWLQGFYAIGEVSPQTPGSCLPQVCPPPYNMHIRVPLGEWYTFDSGNLIESLRAIGAPPATLTRLRIYASGHSYSVMFSELELIGEE